MTIDRVEKQDGEPRWETGKRQDGLRDLGELFEEAPSKESYPEYYARVVKVMDLKTIKKNVSLLFLFLFLLLVFLLLLYYS